MDFYTSSVPYFTGSTYSTLQNFNAANGLTLNFNAFTPSSVFPGISATTFVDISQVGGASVFNVSGGSSLTSATVGAGTLMAGTTYDLSLDYSDRDIETTTGFGGTATDFVGNDVRVDLIFTTAPASVPEPSSLALCGLAGLVGAGLAWRRRKRVA